jgi:hypothetical protein
MSASLILLPLRIYYLSVISAACIILGGGCAAFDYQPARDTGGQVIKEFRKQGINSPEQIEQWIYSQEQGSEIRMGLLALLRMVSRGSTDYMSRACSAYIRIYDSTFNWPRAVVPTYMWSRSVKPHTQEQFFFNTRSTMMNMVAGELWIAQNDPFRRPTTQLEKLYVTVRNKGGYREGAEYSKRPDERPTGGIWER